MPVIMRDEMTEAAGVAGCKHNQPISVSGFGSGQPRGWGFSALGFTWCKH